MSFNLTPTIIISTAEELEAALAELAAEGVDSDWLEILRQRATLRLES